MQQQLQQLPLRKQRPWSLLRGTRSARLLCVLIAWSALLALRGSFVLTALLVSRLMLVIYAIMFGSLSRQADGLLGPRGLVPLPANGPLGRLECPSRLASIASCFAGLMCVLPHHPWSALAVCGMLIWLSRIYRGFMTVDFLRFQWDVLALEAGGLAVLASLAAVPTSANMQLFCSAMAMHGFTLLCFKLMWGSCLCKLLSNCPEWNFGTAMQYHHRTTCLPKPWARTLHRWSGSSQASSIQGLLTLWVEGPLSLLSLTGWPLARAISCVLWCGLMIGIAVSGNYGILECLSQQLPDLWHFLRPRLRMMGYPRSLQLMFLGNDVVSSELSRFLRQSPGLKHSIVCVSVCLCLLVFRIVYHHMTFPLLYCRCLHHGKGYMTCLYIYCIYLYNIIV